MAPFLYEAVMSVFGTSKKTYVSTSVSRLVSDDQIPDPTKKAMIEAVLKNQNIADSILDENLNSSVFKFERMYRYAERGEYFYGLPSARESSEPTVIPVVASVLESLEGQAVTVDYAKLDEALPKHYGYQVLYDDYGYDRIQGEIAVLSQQKGTPVYLKNMLSYVPVTSEADIDFSILQLEDDILPVEYGNRTDAQQDQAVYEALKGIKRVTTTNDFIYDFTVGAQLRVEVFYIWDVAGETQQDSFTVILPDSTDDAPKLFYQVGYFVGPGHYGYWTYPYGSGLHPTLDTFADVQYSKEGTYFPFAIFRRQFTNRTASALEETEEFKTTKRLLAHIDLDFQGLGESIHENPDIADVPQAALVMAVPMNTTNQIESRYLFDYFDRLQAANTRPQVSLNADTNATANNAITWSDADFSLTLSYHDVYKRAVSESFGKPGDYTVGVTDHSYTYTVDVEDRDGTTTETRTAYYKKYHIKKQLTAGLCQVITVVNPVAKYDIDSSRSYESTQDNSILLIPLDYLITRRYKISERTELYHRSLHLVFNAKVVVKLKWYQSGFFKFILLVVAVVLMFIPGGQFAGQVMFVWGLGLTYLAVAMVLVYVAVMVAVSYAFKLLVKEIGAEAAMIIATVLIAYGGYKAFSGAMPAAQTYTALASNLMDASTYVMEQDMKAITDEMEELSALKTKQELELEKAMALLDKNDFLDPFAFIGQQPIYIAGESPTELYTRTIHMGNPADLSYKSIEHYVDISLTLPDINATLERS